MIVIYIAAALIALFLVISFLMPSRYNIEKTIIINKPVAEVMNKVGDLNHYRDWNPWQKNDPNAESTVTGQPKTKGHKYSWQGKRLGVGSLTIAGIDDRHIHFDLEFLKPWKSKAKDNWLFEDWGSNESKITWQNAGDLSWPMARLMGPVINKNLNHQFETGLKNLKQMCEAS
jgi:hypothetical protein